MNLERPSGWLLTTLMRTTSANRFFHGFWLRRKESRTAYCRTTWISFSLNCTGSRTHRTHSTTRAVEALCFVSTKTFSETSLDAQTWSFCMAVLDRQRVNREQKKTQHGRIQYSIILASLEHNLQPSISVCKNWLVSNNDLQVQSSSVVVQKASWRIHYFIHKHRMFGVLSRVCHYIS